ncbi:MAG: hypothetical protein DSY42_01020 [Aquifex sp.]|nr:MAG: hypothetical protein DSY42_01020 [Aquifex sp.]
MKRDMKSLRSIIEEGKIEILLKEFDKKIVERGKKYFEKNSVLDKYILSDNYVHGVIKGTSIYYTDVYLYKGKLYVRCTCPYEGKCKHAVALLFSLSFKGKKNEDSLTLENFKRKIERSLYDYGILEFDSYEWEELIRKYDKDEILNFLISLTIYIVENFIYSEEYFDNEIFVDELLEIFLDYLPEGEKGKYLYEYLASLGEDYELIIGSPGSLFKLLESRDIAILRKLIEENPLIACATEVCAFVNVR